MAQRRSTQLVSQPGHMSEFGPVTEKFKCKCTYGSAGNAIPKCARCGKQKPGAAVPRSFVRGPARPAKQRTVRFVN